MLPLARTSLAAVLEAGSPARSLARALRRTAATEASSPPPSTTPALVPSPLDSPGSHNDAPSGSQQAHELLIEATEPHFRHGSHQGAGQQHPSSSSSPNPALFPSLPSLPPLPTPPTPHSGSSSSSSSSPFSRPPHPHPFDTQSIVKHLEAAGFGYGTSRQIMRATRELVLRRTELARTELLGKEDMENQAYLFKAALSELRTLLSLRTRNGQASVRSLTLSAEREVEGLGDRIKEGVEQLKHEIDIELENRKADTRSEQKAYEIAIEELNNKFTISLGDLRTDIEQYKWEATRKGIVVIATGVLFFVGSTLLFSQEPPPPPPPVLLPPAGAPRSGVSAGKGKKGASGGTGGWMGEEDEDDVSAEGGREVLGGVEGAP